MNKYLEKIAASKKAVNKVELEPGVHYDLTNHELKPTTAHMKEYMDKKDHHSRLASGAMLGAYGGFIGSAIGYAKAKDRLKKEAPEYHFDKDGFHEARREWREKQPFKPEPTKPKFSAKEIDEFMKSNKGRSLDHIPVSREYRREDLLNTRKHKNQMRAWYREQPAAEAFESQRPSGVKPTLTNLAKKYGEHFPRRLGVGLGMAAGGLLAGGVGYAIGGMDPTRKTPLKNAYLEKLERKHEKTIDRLEGWDE